MKSFTYAVLHPVTEEVAHVEVFYRVRDVGVTDRKMRPVVDRVMDGPEDILSLLDAEVIARMEVEADGHDHDERARARFGSEAV